MSHPRNLPSILEQIKRNNQELNRKKSQEDQDFYTALHLSAKYETQMILRLHAFREKEIERFIEETKALIKLQKEKVSFTEAYVQYQQQSRMAFQQAQTNTTILFDSSDFNEKLQKAINTELAKLPSEINVPKAINDKNLVRKTVVHVVDTKLNEMLKTHEAYQALNEESKQMLVNQQDQYREVLEEQLQRSSETSYEKFMQLHPEVAENLENNLLIKNPAMTANPQIDELQKRDAYQKIKENNSNLAIGGYYFNYLRSIDSAYKKQYSNPPVKKMQNVRLAILMNEAIEVEAARSYWNCDNIQEKLDVIQGDSIFMKSIFQVWETEQRAIISLVVNRIKESFANEVLAQTTKLAPQNNNSHQFKIEVVDDAEINHTLKP